MFMVPNNQMSGVIPESICNTDFTSTWLNYENGMFHNNSFCPPYPSCIEDYMGTQDTSGCSADVSLSLTTTETSATISYTLLFVAS